MISDLESDGLVCFMRDVERLCVPEWQACDIEAHWVQCAIVFSITATVCTLAVVIAMALPITIVLTGDIATGHGG